MRNIGFVGELGPNVDRAQEILSRQVGILYKNDTFLLAANIVNAGLVAAVLGPELGRNVYFWCAAVVAVAVVRGVLSLAHRHRHQTLPVLTWAWLFTLGSIVSGIVWGLGCAILFVPGNMVAQLVVAFVAASMAAGAAVGLCAWLPAALGFVTAILMGLLFVLLGQGEAHYNIMAAMTVLMWLALSVIAINANRTIRRSLSVGQENRELSERLQQTETTRAANQARSWFLSAMSHELRTPLNAILGFSDFLRSEAFGPLGSPRYRDYAQDIHSSAEGLLKLVNETLDLSKIESGAIDLQEAPLEIAEVVQAAETMVQEAATASQVRIVNDLSGGAGRLRADARILRQLLLTLLSNAIRFTPRGGAVSLRTSATPAGGLSLSVTDAGPAISEDDIAKLEGDFGAADASLAQIREGTGFSLSVARSLAGLQDGLLSLSSEGATGMTVTIAFPPERVLADSEDPRPAFPAALSQAGE
jgi:two-component system cell cycle sensor histidine kinase PleC